MKKSWKCMQKNLHTWAQQQHIGIETPEKMRERESQIQSRSLVFFGQQKGKKKPVEFA